MTYVVADGKHVIADCFMQSDFGGNLPGRSVPKENNQFVFEPTARDVTVFFNDAHKLVAIPDGKFQDWDIKLIALAGSTRNLPDMLGALTQGVNLQDYIKVEANILPVEERRIFCGGSSLMVTLGDGSTVKLTADGKTIRNWKTPNFIHMGSGSDIVDSIRGLLSIEEGKRTKLTALEAFVVASSHCNTVSRNFDYYDIARDKFYYDARLTDRQTKEILERVNARLNFCNIRNELRYQNK